MVYLTMDDRRVLAGMTIERLHQIVALFERSTMPWPLELVPAVTWHDSLRRAREICQHINRILGARMEALYRRVVVTTWFGHGESLVHVSKLVKPLEEVVL